MDFFHLNCRIVSKAKGKSSVAASAYISAEKLVNERTGLTHDFTRKQDVIFSDTVLCENAPEEFRNREVLWNEVEKVERASDARFARQFDLAIPNEFSKEQAKELFYDVANIFTEQGMCFDGGIHWEPGNHHYDFLVTTRPFKADGSWGDKDKKDYAFEKDENGNKIIDKDNPNWWEDKKNPERCGIRIPDMDSNGNQKTDKKGGKIWKRERVDSTGWDRKEVLEQWRRECCEMINKKAIEYGFDFQIDHRSYERRNIDIVPTIHEGYMARKMESEGLVADRCELNRDIRNYNSVIARMKETAVAITEMIVMKARDILGRFKEFTRGAGYTAKAERDDGYSGKPADTDRGFAKQIGEGGESELDLERGMEQADIIKQRTERTKRDIEGAERKIADTDNLIKRAGEQIAELTRIMQEEEAKRDERLRKLKERRRASQNIGGASERSRGEGQTDCGLEKTASDISAFLDSINAEEQASRAGARDSELERNNRISERMDRENERERLDRERQREAEGRKQRTYKTKGIGR